jgi:hypothetical protein
VLRVSRPGRFRVAVRYSPYWSAGGACVEPRADGMTELVDRHAKVVSLEFDVTLHEALAALRGAVAHRCAGPS